MAVPRRGALLAAGVTLLLPALKSNAEDGGAVAVANPEPLGNGVGADCSAQKLSVRVSDSPSASRRVLSPRAYALLRSRHDLIVLCVPVARCATRSR